VRRYRNIPLSGIIRSRLLVNAVVDPDEAASRLPNGLRPHVGDAGTVVGICLLDIARVRPRSLPLPGVPLRAVAHRIAVTWDGVVGVYVPARLTDSRGAQLVGGRVFPGVHRPAAVDVHDDGCSVRWSVTPVSPVDFAVRVTATRAHGAFDTSEAIGQTCLNANVGLSPGHDGELEAAVMRPSHGQAEPVDIAALDSAFLASFATAQPAQSYLMRDVDVAWTAR
jgi:hypothetical protein